MSRSHTRSENGKNVCVNPQEIEGKLKMAGIQPTAQRIAVCRYVLCEADHPTAEDVKKWADINFPKLSLATVYNTLNVLVRAGLLREFRFPHSDKVFYDQNVEHHYHFLNEDTGAITDLSPAQVEVSLRNLADGYRINDINVVVSGSTL